MHCGKLSQLYLKLVFEMQVKKKEKEKAVNQSKVPLAPQNRSQPLGKSGGKTSKKKLEYKYT